jgi:YHS domain-containing protein
MKTLTIDPVCGMEVTASSRFHKQYDGTMYLFCCEKCRSRFVRDPGEFVYPEGGELEALMRDLDLQLHDSEGAFRSADWVPLFLAPGLAFLAACAKQWSSTTPWDWTVSIHDFTGLWLILLSTFKLTDLKTFATAFQTYDLLAKFFRSYGYIYPFLEITLGLAFLTGHYLTLVSAATAGLMVFTSAGLLIALRKYPDPRPSPGAASRLPLSPAILVANLSIAAMAILVGWFDLV